MVDQRAAATALGSEEVRRLCGDLPDWKVTAILSLDVTAADVATAAAWAGGQDDLDEDLRSLSGPAASVYDLLRADVDDEDR